MKIEKIIVDNGHGSETPGKCSPDKSIREYAWARETAAMLVAELKKRGHDAQLLVPEETDVPLRERVRRVNSICMDYANARSVALISLHINASGMAPEWRSAYGWSAFVGLNASRQSKLLANYLAHYAGRYGLYVRRQYPGRGFCQQSLAMVRDTRCPAVLTENLFMDNEADCRYLRSEAGKRAIVMLHADAVDDYVRAMKSE